MSDRSFAEILVSQLGTLRDHRAELQGAGIVLLVILAYLALEYGLVSAIRKAWRSIIKSPVSQSDQVKHKPLEKPE